jgi:hypothetical protein
VKEMESYGIWWKNSGRATIDLPLINNRAPVLERREKYMKNKINLLVMV